MKTILTLFFLLSLSSCSTFSDAEKAFRNEYGIISTTDHAMRFFDLEKDDIMDWYIHGEEGSVFDYAD